jgi:hypothetical protein
MEALTLCLGIQVCASLGGGAPEAGRIPPVRVRTGETKKGRHGEACRPLRSRLVWIEGTSASSLKSFDSWKKQFPQPVRFSWALDAGFLNQVQDRLVRR